MNWQEIYLRVSEKGKWYLSQHIAHKPKVKQSRILLPALVHPTTRFSLKEKVWLLIGVFFSIVSIVSVIVSMQVGAQQALAGQKTSPLATTFSSSINPRRMPRTMIPSPSPISLEKSASTISATAVPTVRPAPPVVVFNSTPTPCPGVNCNPWGYNFVPGNLIYDPPVDFCNYFACVPSFNQLHRMHMGYVVECNDGMYSQFLGRRVTCILHGGMLRPLYAH